MLMDVKKAHLNGEVPGDEEVFVLLPSEAGEGVARLKRWLYGMRPAAKAWEEHDVTQIKEEGGFRRSISAATVFGQWISWIPFVSELLTFSLFLQTSERLSIRVGCKLPWCVYTTWVCLWPRVEFNSQFLLGDPVLGTCGESVSQPWVQASHKAESSHLCSWICFWAGLRHPLAEQAIKINLR